MKRWLLTSCLLLFAPLVLAGEPGDPAPELAIATWIKGPPVSIKDGKGKQIFVVTIWQTTCPFSRACVPLLSDIQTRYADKGVVVVSVSNQPAKVVREFLAPLGDRVSYRVAIDSQAVTTRRYLQNFNVMTIPQAFLIDKQGRVVWLGHPLNGLQQAIDELLAGKLDLERSKRLARARAAFVQYMQMVRSVTRAQKARPVGEKVLEWGRDDSLLMNDLAYLIATEPGLIKRDLELARRAAQIAYDNTKGQDPNIVDTFARVCFVSGDIDRAIAEQQKAVKLCKDPQLRAKMEKTLTQYRQAQRDKQQEKP